MKKIIDEIFSDKYANASSVLGNPLMGVMYRLAYPFALILRSFGLTPNQITTLSIGFSVLAFFALVFHWSVGLFCLLWGLVILTDFCDGTVARMTNNIRATSFRYDHSSDLFKISLILLGAGIRYDDFFIWMLSTSTLFLFMFYTVLNHDLASARKGQTIDSMSSELKSELFFNEERRLGLYSLILWIKSHEHLVKFCEIIKAVFISIHGHTLLFFLLIPVSREAAITFFVYMITVTLVGVYNLIVSLKRIPKGKCT